MVFNGLHVCLIFVDRSLLLNMPGMFIIITLCSLAGLFMYAYYVDCDPLLQGRATDPNQASDQLMNVCCTHKNLPNYPSHTVSVVSRAPLSSQGIEGFTLF